MKIKNYIYIIILIIVIISCQKIAIATTNTTSSTGKIRIDFPANGEKIQTQEMTIVGWAMSDDSGSKIKIYIDGKPQIAQIQRYERPDVIAGVAGYGGEVQNPNPGFEAKIDVTNQNTGEHEIKAQLLDSQNNLLFEYTRQVYINYVKQDGKIRIDFPANEEKIETQQIEVVGWAMSTDKNSKIKIYIDGKLKDVQIQREQRPDVIEQIKGYGEETQNPKPGFRANISTKDITTGNHEIKAQLLDSQNNLLHEYTRKVNIENKAEGKIRIDFPANGEKIESSKVKITGWAMCTDMKQKIKIYVDNDEITNLAITRLEREDVLSQVKEYGGRQTNIKPGFETIIDIKKYLVGSHQIKAQLIDSGNNVIYTYTREIQIDNPLKGKLHIDSPSSFNQGTIQVKDKILDISGWYLCNYENSNIEIYIDNQKINNLDITKNKRDDVLEKVPGYGGIITNPMPGFDIKLDVSSFSVGTHKLKCKLVLDTGEEILEKEQNLQIEKGHFHIDSPTRTYWDLKLLTIKGWMLSTDKNAQLKVLLNGQEVPITNIQRTERQDVLDSVNGYGGAQTNPKPGFECIVDLSKYTKGTYELSYRLEGDNDEIYEQKTKTINIDYTPRAEIFIDSPTSNDMIENINGRIKGWVMTNIKNPILEIYIDGRKIATKPTREKRDDVINEIIGYGGIENNPLPGFRVPRDFSTYTLGGHSVKAVVKDGDDNGRELASILRTFTVIEQYKLESGTYGLSGQGRALRYYKIGNGPNVYFATFVIHGFEDKWAHDGKELTIIAESFKDRLVKDRDRKILSKWTIYIFPEINPDGAQAGWTNNGPGRHTLKGWTPDGKGVDLNRSWSVGYKKMTGRNYNGTAPFQAPEAAHLRDFLLKHRATKGQTVLIDLHGWTTQLIGDQGICNYYATQFPNNSRTASYGSGYLINWARSELGANGRPARSALIELPSAGINNHQDVVNNNYVGRYIEATLSMLRGL